MGKTFGKNVVTFGSREQLDTFIFKYKIKFYILCIASVLEVKIFQHTRLQRQTSQTNNTSLMSLNADLVS